MVSPIKFRSSKDAAGGFTIIELTIVMAVISILVTMSFAFIPNAQRDARNRERASDALSLARFFEQRYKEYASVSYPSYPSTATLPSEMNILMNSGLKDAAIAPGQTANSVTVATSNGDLTSNATHQGYIYQPFSSDGTLCTVSTSNDPCTRFKIWYKTEATTPELRIIESRYQQ